ncbi:carbohydrate ABC transporter permease [Actinomyces sp. oral taxon 448]|jgi:ABC transporter, permease protein|uniref:carbohydrate ABC transporter permease n=1 Tax=Actinomyces sp. oral taxon 448 TaxID=712124 RepID=UPI000218A0F5|nr:sugar ABC transporter permease [Actinomyces sp. oral taxon 448]EGQ74314.1 sugar ABC superfamily ATP binding cassette transporter, membrane protein [Actinomyces sp. oral taxon 448 str. F0400]
MSWISSRWKITIMLLPALVFFTAFIAYPVLYALRISLSDFAGFGEARFVGVENYSRLADDPFFWTALRNTIVILVVAVVVVIPLSFGLALLLDRRLPAVGALRALVFAPAIIAPILVGLIWVFILDPSIGLVNRLLSLLGLPSVEWIGGDTLSPYSIAMVFIWSTVGFTMTIFYAGLQQLPHEVIEASQIDGASFWQRQRHVVIPMMRETFGIVLVLVITNVFKIFELVYQLTGGGPVHRSETLVSYMYFVTFTNQKYGPGMAIAVIIFVLGAAISIVNLVLNRSRSNA